MYFYLLLFIICYLLLINKMNIPGGIIIAACWPAQAALAAAT